MIRALLSMGKMPLGKCVLAVVLGTIAALSSIALMGTSAFLITRAAMHRPLLELNVAIVCVRFFALARVGARYAERVVGHDVALQYLVRLRAEVFRRVEPLVPQRFDTTHSGDVLSRLVRDVDAMQDVFVRVWLPLVVSSLSALLLCGVVLCISFPAGLVLVCTLVVASVLSLVAKNEKNVPQNTRAKLHSGLIDVVVGKKELQLYGAMDRKLQEIYACNVALQQQERRLAWRQGMAQMLGIWCIGIGSLCVAAVSYAQVHARHLRPELFSSLVMVSLASLELVSPIPIAVSRYRELIQAATRIMDLVTMRNASHQQIQMQNGIVAGGEPGVSNVVSNVVTSAVLHVRDATLHYANRSQPAFANVTFSLRAGESVALTGRSGSGKTSLAEAIAAFRPLKTGQIQLHGIDIATMEETNVRDAVGYVPEDAYIFPMSLRDNLRVGKSDATDDELATVIQRVRLDKWLEGLREGWATQVGEFGNVLSGGQQRRLVVARMLLRNPVILIIDEPCAGLDEETADALVADLVAAARMSRTALLLISHRARDGELCDRVLYLENGIKNETAYTTA